MIFTNSVRVHSKCVSLCLTLLMALVLTVPAFAQWGISAPTPVRQNDNVVSSKAINGGTHGARLEIKLQTKVCGFWGCNWHTKNSQTINIPARINSTARVSMPCRSGTHRYRTWVKATYFSDGSSASAYSTEPEYTCP